LYFKRNFLFKFRQYFRFFTFFKYILRFSKKKNTKGWLSYFFLLPRLKKNRNSRMGKGVGAYKGFMWQAIALTPFLYLLNTNIYFFIFFLKKIKNKLPFNLFFCLSNSFIFKKFLNKIEF